MLTVKIIVAALLAAAGIVLGTLKVSGSISWPWWLVLAPLYPVVAYGAWIGACVLMLMWVFKDGHM